MNSTMEAAILKLKALDGQVTSQIIKDLIESHKSKRNKMIGLYKRYKGKVPILNRELPEHKVNNKLANDYRGDIVDNITGYLFGKPVTYQINNKKYDETKYDKYKQAFDDFHIRNSIDDLDSKTGKMANICGYGSRLCYIDQDGFEKVMDIKPWECIFIENGSTGEPQYALRYYTVTVLEKEGYKERTKVEWYDSENITFYIQNKEGEYILDNSESVNPLPHMFSYIPLIKFPGNDEEQGVFEKVENLIDAYDKLLSDSQNEAEEFRLAYMVFYGIDVEKETVDKARQTGAFGIPDKEGKADFLTKEINDTFIENHKRTLNGNIYKFSKTVDMSDEKFSGSAMTGEARKWKLLALENISITKERKFSKALRQMFKVICSAWNKKGINLNYLDIYFTFNRNIPVDLQYMGEVAGKFKGTISDKTLLSLLPFIDNPDKEIDRIKEERADRVDLDKIGDRNVTEE
ncbi:phage portal protein [Dethiothermospora halolimnae]|uniref:phage portal protein n=1 Tax=Dethiothermospora halolimnae TaxID=3114390 RepID=UPI003CCB7FB6